MINREVHLVLIPRLWMSKIPECDVYNLSCTSLMGFDHCSFINSQVAWTKLRFNTKLPTRSAVRQCCSLFRPNCPRKQTTIYIINAILLKQNGRWVWTVDFDASPQKRHERSMIPPTSVSHDEVSAVVQTTGRTAPGASSVRSCDLNLRHLELGESPQLDCRLFWNFLYPFYCETWTSVSKIFLLQTTVSPKTNSQLAASSYKFEPSDMVREKGNWSVRMRYLDPCEAAANEKIDIYTQVMASRLSDWPKQQGLLDIPCFVPVGTHSFVPTLWVFREDQRFWGVNTAPSRTHPPDSGANQICSLKEMSSIF